MKHKHRVWYEITNFSGWWWQKGRWVQEYNPRYCASSNAPASTFKKALKIASACPVEMTILKIFFKHGKRWYREIILREEGR